MNPIELLKTIYYQDAWCTKIIVNNKDEDVGIYLSGISRIRDPDGIWRFYNDEDIENVGLILSGVKETVFDNSGLVPNDEIYDIYATKLDDKYYEFIMNTSYIYEKIYKEITVKIIFQDIYLIDPKHPNIQIRD